MYAVDLEELLDTIAAMARSTAALDSLLSEMSAHVAALHDVWSGQAATAQSAAQAEWEVGFRSMRDALAAMRAAAATAHESYSEAAATNVRMWEQVR